MNVGRMSHYLRNWNCDCSTEMETVVVSFHVVFWCCVQFSTVVWITRSVLVFVCDASPSLCSGGENALHRFGCCYFSWVACYRLVRSRQMIYYVRGSQQQYVLHGNRVRYYVIIFSIHQSHKCDQTQTSTFSVESERKTKVTPIARELRWCAICPLADVDEPLGNSFTSCV